MIKHVVMWKLAEEAGGKTKRQNAEDMKDRLEALNDRIEGMNWLEVGLDLSNGENSYDVALYSEFDTLEALNAYQVHPAHKEIAEFIAQIALDRKIVDYKA